MKAVSTTFEWKAGGAFFGGFDNTEILDADVLVKVRAARDGAEARVSSEITGTVTVLCDRCLSEVVLPVEVSDSEKVPLPEDGADLDLSQLVYDYVCTALPMIKVHPDGGCDPDTVKYLCHEGQPVKGSVQPEDVPDNPFAALKGLFDKDI